MAKEYRTAGELQSRKIIAEADRERTHIEAESYAKAQRLRAEGDAEAARIYAAAFSQNPALLQVPAHACRHTRSSSTRAPRCSFRPMRKCCACCAPQPGQAALLRRSRRVRSIGSAARSCPWPAPWQPGAGSAPPTRELAPRRGESRAMTTTPNAWTTALAAPHWLRGRWRYWIGLLAVAARDRLSGNRLLRRERRRARRGAPVRSHRGPRRAGHALSAALAGGRVDVLKTTSVMKIGVGFALPESDDSQTLTGVELLTGDTNILNVALVVQYVIGNPVRLPVPDRAAAGAGGNAGAERADRDGGRHAGRRGADHRPARHPGARASSRRRRCWTATAAASRSPRSAS